MDRDLVSDDIQTDCTVLNHEVSDCKRDSEKFKTEIHI
jgi:hypothetical protein